ncbi:Glu-tRNA(Gln) amidotransferase subunit GatE [archaeon]|jgi:Glu-tRNA(Gln) amidotransferase subunit E-like FAD-binding protein|nr:Glu-tRNA(Gln) amidotransferase subunit GatE [archaeon]
MTINYKKLGFKSGLEIHQQLDTSKLFCNCPSLLRQDEPDFVVSRKLHAVAGESGKIDIAAKHESEQEKEFVYQGYDTTCLVELDEEPPHSINPESLKVALQIALLLNCKIFPISQVMRKMVINGSNTSGFQRTALIAYDGWVETSYGKVGIDAIFLEEDSARPVSRSKEKDVYRLDRLGIPLVEIATKPDIWNAWQAKECALKIGEILRSCKVRRGIGTIRQDVNISIKGSNRVELKGFQDPKTMEKVIDTEIMRQKAILDKGEVNVSEVRNVLPDSTSEFIRPMSGSARMYPETDLELLKISKKLIDETKKNLPRLLGDIEEELEKKGLSKEMIKMILKGNKFDKFKEMFEVYNNANLVAKILLVFPKDIAKRENKDLFVVEETLTNDILQLGLEKVRDKKISEDQLKQFLERVVRGEEINSAIKFEKVNLNEIDEKIMKIIKGKPGLAANAYMGLVMKEFKGKIDGKQAMSLIAKHL